MTELERHLLNALEQLQQDYMQRLNEWESAFVELQKMFSLTQQDNAMLNEQVMQLSQQVQHLSERTERASYTARTGDKGRTADTGART
ncbi:MbeD family mobilization/exclusion protein [Escherichia coli]|uniref:MbeD family mobilization/exclusion protein n=1 Tax=Escherichia coli TaxID=562 RepID=UPI00388D6857